jgi:hypothetical protein
MLPLSSLSLPPSLSPLSLSLAARSNSLFQSYRNVPADVPSTGIYSVIREQPGTFLVIYNKSSTTTAARFNLGDGASKAVDLDGVGSLSFFSMPKAQDAGTDYFFGSAYKSVSLPSHVHTLSLLI